MPPASPIAMATAAARRRRSASPTSSSSASLVLDPQLALGEAYMDGRLGDAAGPHLRPARAGARATLSGSELPALDQEPRRHPLSRPPHAAVQSGAAGAAQRGPSLRHRRHHLRSLPRSRPAVLLRLFRRTTRRSGGGAARQEAPHRRQARHRAGPARARHRLGLGRPRAVSRQDRRLRRDRRDAQRRAAQDLAASAPPGRASPAPCASSSRTTARSTASSTASSRSACSSTSASTTTPPTSARCASCWPTTAWR